MPITILLAHRYPLVREGLKEVMCEVLQPPALL